MPPIVSKQTGGSQNSTTRKATPPTRTSKSSVIDRIAPVEFEEGGLKCLVYGQSGTGKTTFWSTFPGPILAIICSGGMRPGELRSVNTPELRKKISQVVLQNTLEVREVVAHVAATDKYRTLVLDHVSGLQDLVLKELLNVDELPAQKGWGLASQQMWGQCTAQCKEYLRAMLNLGGNVVIVGQERTFGGRDDGLDPELITPTVGVAVTPSLAGWLLPACDYVVQTFKRARAETSKATIGGKEVTTTRRGKGVDYVLRTGPNEVYITKFRVPKGVELPEYITDPTYDKVTKLINRG